MNTPLKADGLSRRVYPFIGLAIVGLVSLHGSAAVGMSPVLLAALVVGVLLALAPLAPIKLPAVGRPILSIPVIVGLGLALFPLWEPGSAFGIAASVVLIVLGGALVLLP